MHHATFSRINCLPLVVSTLLALGAFNLSVPLHGQAGDAMASALKLPDQAREKAAQTSLAGAHTVTIIQITNLPQGGVEYQTNLGARLTQMDFADTSWRTVRQGTVLSVIPTPAGYRVTALSNTPVTH